MTKSDSSETLFNTANYRLASNRRIKILSGGLFVNKKKSSDFRREIVSLNEFNTDRNLNDPAKRLFDSNKNNPNSMSDFRSNKHDLKTYPRRSYDHRPQTFRSKTASVGENDDLKYKIMINSSFNDEDPHKRFAISAKQPIQLKERWMELSNETDSKHPDRYVDLKDLDPEILLQPEIRPIPHDQLVVEVKGIYDWALKDSETNIIHIKFRFKEV